MYCSTSLVEDTGLFSWVRQTYYILRWRWQLKQKRENLEKKSLSVWGGLAYFCLGMLLSATGVYVFTLSVSESSFSNALIAVLLLIYGFFTLRTFLARR